VGNEIEKLDAEIRNLNDQLCAKLQERKQLQINALPWKIGDVVRMTATRYGAERGSEWKVTGIYNEAHGWALVVGRKKDGTWGVRTRTLHGSFEVVQP
jgi:hypothetical protein